MRKLELKDLAPYVPFQPNVLCVNKNAVLKVTGIYKKHNKDEYFDILLLNWDLKLKSTEIKPILMPLSDLLKLHMGSATFADVIEYECSGYQIGNRVDVIDFNQLPYEVVQKLLSWKFDIFGLIDLGLAVDINTLKEGE